MRSLHAALVFLVLLLGAEAIHVKKTTDLSADTTTAAARVLSDLLAGVQVRPTSEVANELVGLVESPTVRAWHNSLDDNPALQFVPRLLAASPHATKLLLHSQFGKLATELIGKLDTVFSGVDSGEKARPSVALASLASTASHASAPKWQQLLLDVTPESHGMLQEVNGTVVLVELEGDEANASDFTKWQDSLDKGNLVFFGVLVIASLASLISIIILLFNVAKIHHSHAMGGVVVMGVMCLSFFLVVASCHMIGMFIFAKRTGAFMNNFVLMMLEGNLRQLVGHSLLSSKATTTSSSALASAYTAYSSLNVRSENLCLHAFPMGAALYKDGVRVMNYEIANKAMRVSYAAEGEVGTWNPIARWNAELTENEKHVPNPSYCSLTPPISAEECPGYYLDRYGKSSYCDCVEVMQIMGFPVKTTELTACVLDKRDKYLTKIEEMFGSDVASAAARRAKLLADYTCQVNSFSAAGATLDQGSASANFCPRTTSTKAVTSLSSLSLGASPVLQVNLGGPAIGSWAASDTSGLTIQGATAVPDAGSTPAVDDADFQNVLNSYVYAAEPNELELSMEVEPSQCYRLQLVNYEKQSERVVDVYVEDVTAFAGVSTWGVLAGSVPGAASLVTQFQASSSTASVRIVGHKDAVVNDPLFNALVLEKVEPVSVTRLASVEDLGLDSDASVFRLAFGGAAGTFTDAFNTPGITVTTQERLSNHHEYSTVPTQFGDVATNTAMHSFASPVADIVITADLAANQHYSVQVIAYERDGERSLNIDIDDQRSVSNFCPFDLTGSLDTVGLASAAFKSSGQTKITLSGVVDSRINVPMINGLVINKLTSAEFSVSNMFYSKVGAADSDNPAFSFDSIAVFQANEATEPSMQWKIHHCTGGTYMLDFRYAAAVPVVVAVYVDDLHVQDLTLDVTGGDTVFMRNNFLIPYQILTEGDHIVKVVKKANQGGVLRVHRFNVCKTSDGAQYGCHLHKMSDTASNKGLACFSEHTQSAMTTALTGGVGANNFAFADLNDALSVCTSRSDCDGVQQEGSSYLLRSGAVVSGAELASTVHQKSHC